MKLQACTVVHVSAGVHGDERYPTAKPYFFFQAEDGIRDLTVTGVQTCALPISFRVEPVEVHLDLVKTWWYNDGEMYFDWFHAEGAFPNEGKVQMGAKVDLFEWMLKSLKNRGCAGQKLAADIEFPPSAQKKVVNVLGKEMTSAEETCMGMRMRKTPEELALMRRAYNYFNQLHSFACDMLLGHGTDLTDFEIASAATKYGTDPNMSHMKREVAPHTAVASE